VKATLMGQLREHVAQHASSSPSQDL
jgi:hypothetical protein